MKSYASPGGLRQGRTRTHSIRKAWQNYKETHVKEYLRRRIPVGLSKPPVDGSGNGFNEHYDCDTACGNAEYWESEIEEEDQDDDFVHVNEARNLLGLWTRVREQAGDDVQDIEQKQDQRSKVTEGSGSGCPDGDQGAPEVEAQVPEDVNATQGDQSPRRPPIPPSPEFTIHDGPQPRKPDTPPMNDFHLGISLFVLAMDLSEFQYTILIEVLAKSTTESIASLPRTLKTLRKWARRWLPLQTIKAQEVTVDKGQIRTADELPLKKIYYFDIKEYGETWLSNPCIRQNMHFGLGHFTDSIQELWQARAWMESIRTTSGEFVRTVPNDDDTIIFPSDCVSYTVGDYHRLGQVVAVGKDYRAGNSGKESVMIVPLFTKAQLAKTKAWDTYIRHAHEAFEDTSLNFTLESMFDTEELVIMEGYEEIVPVDDVIRREYIWFCDYESSEECVELLPQAPQYHVLTIVYHAFTYDGNYQIRTVDKRHKTLSEREILTYGREALIRTFQGKSPGVDVFSLPYTVFIDGFGLFRNSHHSLDGLYLIPASLNFTQRNTLNNVNVWSLGPPGSSQHDLAKTLQHDSLMAEDGFDTKINGCDTRIIMMALAYVADMPQQNKLAGVKSPLATHGCRSCMVSMKQLGDPTIDIPFIARYEKTVELHKAWINEPNILAGEKHKRAAETGLQDDGPPFASCNRCFDPYKCV